MKNTFIVGLLLAGLVLIAGKSYASLSLIGGGGDACNYTVVEGTSGFVFTGPGTVFDIILSSGNGITDSILVDTQTAAGSFNSASDIGASVWNNFQVTPILAHSSTTIMGGGGAIGSVEFRPGGFERGVRLKNGCAVVGNGASNSIGVYWKQ